MYFVWQGVTFSWSNRIVNYCLLKLGEIGKGQKGEIRNGERWTNSELWLKGGNFTFQAPSFLDTYSICTLILSNWIYPYRDLWRKEDELKIWKRGFVVVQTSLMHQKNIPLIFLNRSLTYFGHCLSFSQDHPDFVIKTYNVHHRCVKKKSKVFLHYFHSM